MKKLFVLFSLLVIASLALTACGPAAATVPAADVIKPDATESPATEAPTTEAATPCAGNDPIAGPYEFTDGQEKTYDLPGGEKYKLTCQSGTVTTTKFHSDGTAYVVRPCDETQIFSSVEITSNDGQNIKFQFQQNKAGGMENVGWEDLTMQWTSAFLILRGFDNESWIFDGANPNTYAAGLIKISRGDVTCTYEE